MKIPQAWIRPRMPSLPLWWLLGAETGKGLQAIFRRAVGATGLPRTWWQFMARGLEHLKLDQRMKSGPGKVLQAEHEAPAFTKKPEAARRQAPCWGLEAVFLHFRGTERRKGQSPPCCQTVSGHIRCSRGQWQSSCSKSSTGLLLWAQRPKVLCSRW